MYSQTFLKDVDAILGTWINPGSLLDSFLSSLVSWGRETEFA
jgi:hypothetical protein